MHNLPMRRPRAISALRPGLRPLAAVLLALLLALSACGGGDSDPSSSSSESAEAGSDDDGDASETPATEDEPYLPVPDGVELTAQGSGLDVGDTAVVAYEPRQDVVGALEITVTALVNADFKDFVGWKLTPETRKTNPYFVKAFVKNVGDTNLGGQGVPLYAVDGNNRLIEASSFQSTFKPCSPESFPKSFKGGDKGKFCLVYLAPDKGDLTAVSFRPVEDFDPITWTGKLVRPGAGDKKGDDKGGQNKGDDKKGDDKGGQNKG
jgi:hypothetical protein